MNCIKCKRQVSFMFRPKEGFICGSCLIPRIEADDDIDQIPIVREAYLDQFSIGVSAEQPISTFRPVLEAMEKCLQQTR